MINRSKWMNLEIREFEKAIMDFVGKSQLPPEVKRICLENIRNQVKDKADESIREELKQRDRKESEEKEDE